MPILFDIAIAYFIARNLRSWRNWLPLSLIAGAVIAVLAALAVSAMGDVDQTGRSIFMAVITNACIAALNTWGFSKFVFKNKKV